MDVLLATYDDYKTAAFRTYIELKDKLNGYSHGHSTSSSTEMRRLEEIRVLQSPDSYCITLALSIMQQFVHRID